MGTRPLVSPFGKFVWAMAWALAHQRGRVLNAARVIYLDSNATTCVAPEVLEAMLPFLRDQFVNPSATYRAARTVRRAVEKAREQVAALLGADAEEVIFTSGGTEAINTAHASVRALWPERRRLIIGATEHAAVWESAQRWRQSGGEVAVAPVDRQGLILLPALEQLLAEAPTGLVSIMWANNETGVVAPMAEIVRAAQAAGAQVHADAVQAVGKLALDVTKVPIDYLSLSGHKMHAPKGIGALWVSKRRRFQPLLVGGGQENERRGGTENVPGVVALGAAAAAMKQGLAEGTEAKVRALRDRFEAALQQQVPGLRIHGAEAPRLGTTSSLGFPGLDAAGLLILLDQAGIACSAGSACHSAALHPSPVLAAMGLDAATASSTLRFSWSRFTTAEETDAAVQAVSRAVNRMRQVAAG